VQRILSISRVQAIAAGLAVALVGVIVVVASTSGKAGSQAAASSSSSAAVSSPSQSVSSAVASTTSPATAASAAAAAAASSAAAAAQRGATPHAASRESRGAGQSPAETRRSVQVAPPAVARPAGRPGPANTGVPAGTPLTVVNGDVTVTTNGTVIDGKDIKGALIIRASNVTVTRSLIEGSAASDSVVVAGGSGILLQDDEVAVTHPTVSHDAMSVHNATLNRLNIHGGVDGMKLGSNSTVENCWIHGLNYFASDPAQHGGPTHNDAIQIMSGTDIHLTGNYLQATASNNSALQVTQDTGTVSGLFVSGNWADGGGCTFNFSGHGPGGVHLAMSGVSAIGNRFGHNTHFASCAILTDLQTTLTQSGNVYDDTGLPAAIQRHN
jgi:hypothetical protein